MSCLGINAEGQPCNSPDHLVDASGYCPAHRDGGRERMQELASLGGQAQQRKFGGTAFEAGDLKPIASLEDAKTALDEIRVAVLTRRITHSEGSAASKAVAEWVKAESATVTQRLVNELRAELEAKQHAIEELRKQVNAQARPMRVAR